MITLKLGDFVAVRPKDDGFGYNREAEVVQILGEIPHRTFKLRYNNKETEVVSASRIVAVTIESRR